MTEQVRRHMPSWKINVLSVIGLMLLGGVIGWFSIGPSLVDRWVLIESPGSLSYEESLFHRDMAMLIGAIAGGCIALAVGGLAVAARSAVDRAIPSA